MKRLFLAAAVVVAVAGCLNFDLDVQQYCSRHPGQNGCSDAALADSGAVSTDAGSPDGG